MPDHSDPLAALAEALDELSSIDTEDSLLGSISFGRRATSGQGVGQYYWDAALTQPVGSNVRPVQKDIERRVPRILRAFHEVFNVEYVERRS